MCTSNQKSKNNFDSLCTPSFDDLPPELLKLILERIRGSVGDLSRVSAVCRSWKVVADSIKDVQGQEQHIGPFLLRGVVCENDENDEDEHILYSLIDFYKNRVHQTRVPFDNTHCLMLLNSWNQWIVTVYSCFTHIRFLNLLSREEIDIPPLIYPWNIAISSTTPLDPNCIFLATFGKKGKLALYEQGGKNKKWNRLISKEFGQYYNDIIYFKGEFYAVDKNGILVVLRDIDKEVKVLKVTSTAVTWTLDFMYLVESCGHLFLIIRTLRLKNEDSRMMFEAYKLNFSRGWWEKVKSLGDAAFFIGHTMSLSVSAKDFPVKRDCIYHITYTHDDSNNPKGRDVFNLNTNQFE